MKNSIHWAIWVIIASVIVGCVLMGCSTPRNIAEKVETSDSIGSAVKVVHDTVIVHDTIYTSSKTITDAETEEETILNFADGGGTYNANTGEATNVKSATTKKSKREKELEERLEKMTHNYESVKNSLDSARVVNAIFKSDNKSEPVGMSKIQRFFHTSGIVAWCVIAVGLIVLVVWLLRKFKVIP